MRPLTFGASRALLDLLVHVVSGLESLLEPFSRLDDLSPIEPNVHLPVDPDPMDAFRLTPLIISLRSYTHITLFCYTLHGGMFCIHIKISLLNSLFLNVFILLNIFLYF